MRAQFGLASILLLGLFGCSGPATAPSVEAIETGGVAEVAPPASDPVESAGDPGGVGVEGADDAGLPEAAPSVDAGAATDAATKPAAALLAEEAARELAAMKSSSYQHTTHVDEPSGTFDYDCSGFVDYALGRVLPSRLAAFGIARPLAKDYQGFFAGIDSTGKKGGWRRVTRAADLDAGDVVAWLKPADVASTNTGHVLIVRAKSSVNPARADEILVPVTDSTASPHGPSDSRAPSGDGLGTGTIGLLIDAAGAPIGYRWTGGYSSKLEYTSVALGHLDG